MVIEIPGPGPGRRTRTILIADDDEATRLVLRQIFKRQAYNVVEAADGRSACDLARRERPDVVLMDWSMPIMNGFDALRELKRDDTTATIPVLMLTTHAEIDERVLAIDAEAQDYLIKPCDPRELFARVEQQLRWRGHVADETADEARAQKDRELSQLRESAMRDPLTGFANAQLLNDRVARHVERAAGNGARFAEISLSLDEFGEVDDRCGRTVGDDVLRIIAIRLAATIGEREGVARVGRDEFALLAPDLASPHAACELADRLLVAVRTPFDVGDATLSLSASIGIGFYPFDGDAPRTLLERAGSAMLRAKAAGGNRYRLADETVLLKAHDWSASAT